MASDIGNLRARARDAGVQGWEDMSPAQLQAWANPPAPPSESEQALRRLKAAATATHKAIALVAINKMKLKQARQDSRAMDLSKASITVRDAAQAFRNSESQLEKAIASEVQANIQLVELDLTDKLASVKIDTVSERQEGSDAAGSEPTRTDES